MACNSHDGVAAGTCLICAFALSFVMACVTSFSAALTALFLGVLFFLCMGHPDRGALHSLMLANSFILLIWLIVPWTANGKVLYEAVFFRITDQGVLLCLLATLKANAVILLFLGIMRNMTPMKLGLAFAQLHFSSKLALILVFSVQQIENLKSEWKILRDAAKLRGFQTTTSFSTWKTLASMIAYLIVRADDRAETLYDALLLRGFSGKFPLCCQWSFGRKDFFLILATFCSITALLAINNYDFYVIRHLGK